MRQLDMKLRTKFKCLLRNFNEVTEVLGIVSFWHFLLIIILSFDYKPYESIFSRNSFESVILFKTIVFEIISICNK